MIKLLTRIKKSDIPLILINIMLIVTMVFFELQIPEYMTEITTIIGTTGVLSDVMIVGVKMLFCAVLSALCSVAVGFIAAKVSANFAYNLRGEIYKKVQGLSLAEIKGFSTASLITRSTNDITQVQLVVTMGLQLLIKSPIMAVYAIIKILSNGWQWGVATAVAILFITSILIVVVVFALPKFRQVQRLNDNLNRVSRESLTGVRVVRAFNAEEYENGKFEKANSELTNNFLSVNKVMSLIDPSMAFVMSALPLAIYFIGAMLIAAQPGFVGKLDVFSNMMVFSSYAIQVVMSFVMLIVIFINLPRASVSASRIREVLDSSSSIVDGCGKKSLTVGEVEFKNVAFKYPDAEEYVLKDISFKANKGEVVAFIGSTGSGKSTLINLVPRFYDVTEGEVLVDGVNVKDYKLYDLNSKIGMVFQRPTLFSGTVKTNLQLGEADNRKPTEEDMEKALKISMSDFVYGYEDSIDHKVNQGGKNYSGGQKQRLAIAMAIARNPEVMIFDDSFSALDYGTDKKLRQAIKRDLTGMTCLIVAQRIGTIKNADKIVVLDKGRIVGIGKHKELLKTCDVYREIALSQLSKEELGDV